MYVICDMQNKGRDLLTRRFQVLKVHKRVQESKFWRLCELDELKSPVANNIASRYIFASEN